MLRFSPALSYPAALIRAGFVGAALLIASAAGSGAAAEDYKIQPGDSLYIEVLEDSSLNRSLLVAPDGRVSVPGVGSIRVAGQTVDALQRALTARLSASFAAPPNVFIALEQLAARAPESQVPAAPASISVYVMGEANNPGRLDVAPGTTVLQMFAVMGGFTKFAATKRIQLRRFDPASQSENVYNLNYPRIEAGARNSRTTLADGDVIVVPQRRLFE